MAMYFHELEQALYHIRMNEIETVKEKAPHAELRKLQKMLVLTCAKREKIKVSRVVSTTGWKKQKAIAILVLLERDGIVKRDEYDSNIFWII